MENDVLDYHNTDMKKKRSLCKYYDICIYKQNKLPCVSDAVRFNCDHASAIERDKDGYLL